MEMLESEHAQDITVLDIREKSEELDYLIVATVNANRHRKAVAGYVYMQVSSK